MLSWPRLEPYTKRPEGAIAISDVVLLPVKSVGSVVMTCRGLRPPRSASKR